MKRCLLVLIICVTNVLTCLSETNVENLRCEYLRDPLGIDTAQPRLSWQLQSDRRGVKQTAYRVLVASSEALLLEDKADLWDSGKVASDQSIYVAYAGKPLASKTACYWKVRVWDEKSESTAWSRTARWTMGLLAPGDWQAQWIGAPAGSFLSPVSSVSSSCDVQVSCISPSSSI